MEVVLWREVCGEAGGQSNDDAAEDTAVGSRAHRPQPAAGLINERHPPSRHCADALEELSLGPRDASTAEASGGGHGGNVGGADGGDRTRAAGHGYEREGFRRGGGGLGELRCIAVAVFVANN